MQNEQIANVAQESRFLLVFVQTFQIYSAQSGCRTQNEHNIGSARKKWKITESYQKGVVLLQRVKKIRQDIGC